MPSQNAGAAMPSKLNTVNVRSRMLYCLRALIMPTGMPISSSKKMPYMAIMTVAGKRSMIDWATGRWVSYEKPMSPCSRFFR